MDSAAFFARITLLIIFQINPIQGSGYKYTSSTNNAYFIDTEQKYTWIESLIACMEMNMTLVTIDSLVKSDEINTLIRNNFGNVRLWIGGVFIRVPSSHFVWVATGKTFSYANWRGYNPSIHGRKGFCTQIGWANKLEWSGSACAHQQGFICEYAEQQNKQSEQMQHDLENEKKKLQELQQQHQQTIQKQHELQEQMQQKQMQQDKLKQELEDIEEQNRQERRKHQQLQMDLEQEIQDQQDKLKQDLRDFTKLEKDMQNVLTDYENLKKELQKQENLKEQLKRELQNIEETQQIPSNETNKKYRDIILHFHQNQ